MYIILKGYKLHMTHAKTPTAVNKLSQETEKRKTKNSRPLKQQIIKT